ncbi:hypothetical protein H8K90_14100 [Winogradskyella echinorum]|uniref:Uncharacterized protein n=1 Tax=Winogradskyella echinorum TaxID=538189 RepID=A0ABR6Y442_9FLAO|nr:hypothetical protein [Winogradskyella echinorum]MBC3847525.1 hypothetical protein [Winogradskyella echinorum]MBC5751873.1 hypothetical protein [Winogradskyella echinorum]
MKTNFIRKIILVLLGFLTFPLLKILPVGNGGVIIGIVYTVPFILLIAIIMIIIYSGYYLKENRINKNKAFYLIVLALIVLNLILFPHK